MNGIDFRMVYLSDLDVCMNAMCKQKGIKMSIIKLNGGI